MATKSHLILLIISVGLALVGGVAVTGLLTTSRTIGSSGIVKAINVEVYRDLECTQAVDEIDWGTIEPGESVTRTVYIKNAGNAALTLNLSYYGWDPPAAGSYITLSWDREGETMEPQAVLAATLTLSVSDAISGITDFSFSIVIKGTG